MADIEKSWVAEIKNKMKEMNPSTEPELWKHQSIYQVPACIKDLNEKAYKPQVVSFGPYHHDDVELLQMEEHKERSLFHFLHRASKPLEDFVIGMEEIVQQLLNSYKNLDEDWRKDKEKFLKLMIVDGCFMLEVVRVTTGHVSDYLFNDPIFGEDRRLYTMPYIKRDMLMIENQLPLLVLEKLVAVDQGKPRVQNEDYINRLVLKFCAPTAPSPPQGVGLGLHPLSLLRRSMLHGPQVRSGRQRRPVPASGDVIRSALELYEAGIRLKKSKGNNSLWNIRFHNGKLRLPVIVVDDATEYMFLNLMAFERLHVGAGNEVTSYVSFMDNIIDSEKDVSLLHSKGIIQNAMGSDKAIAKLFNSLSKDVVLDPESDLEEVHRRVNEYCRKPWNRWQANLIQTYFRSPWALISLAAAIFLLVLTVAQTIYTIYPYYHPLQQDDSSPPTALAPPPAPSPRRH